MTLVPCVQLIANFLKVKMDKHSKNGEISIRLIFSIKIKYFGQFKIFTLIFGKLAIINSIDRKGAVRNGT